MAGSKIENPTTIEQLLYLAESLTTAQEHVADLERQLTVAKADQRRLEEEDIPGLLTELSVTEFAFTDGRKVTVKPELEITILEANRPRCWQWMTEHQHDGLIKTMVIAEYGRGKIADAERKLAALRAEGLDAQLVRAVHPQTLKAWAKEQLASNQDVPDSIFTYRTFSKARISKPKEKP